MSGIYYSLDLGLDFKTNKWNLKLRKIKKNTWRKTKKIKWFVKWLVSMGGLLKLTKNKWTKNKKKCNSWIVKLKNFG